MQLTHHNNLDIDKWYSKSVSFQLANVGSEISRTINWQRKGRQEHADLAFERALELIDITVSDPKNHQRMRELLRLKEVLTAWKFGDQCFCDGSTESENWIKYFEPYNYYARLSENKI